MSARFVVAVALAMSATSAGPLWATSTSLLTVYGDARLDTGEQAGAGCRVIVENLTRGVRDSVELRAEDAGKYVVTLIDYQGGAVAAIGDQIKVTLRDAVGEIVPVPTITVVTQEHVDTHLLRVNVSLVDVDPRPTPGSVSLSRTFPEPFRARTRIHFQLARRDRARLTILDASGRLIRTLVDGDRDSGAHEEIWDGRATDGRRVTPGVYYVRMETGTYRSTRRVTLLR